MQMNDMKQVKDTKEKSIKGTSLTLSSPPSSVLTIFPSFLQQRDGIFSSVLPSAIAVVKGNTVVLSDGEIFATGLGEGAVEFKFKSYGRGVTEPLNGALNSSSAPFTLKLTKTIVLDGKSIEISEESFDAFKKQFLGDE